MADAGLRFLALVSRNYTDIILLKQDFSGCVHDVIDHFSSDLVNVRKSAISVFIDLFNLIGEENFDFFNLLDSFQLKLVIERMRQI